MNFSLSSAGKGAAVALAAVLVGCGGADNGDRDFADGKAAYELRDLKKAEKLLEKSRAAAPEDVDRLLYVARVKLDLGDLAAAQEAVSKAAALADGDADVALLEAQIAWHARDYAAAAEGFSALAADAKLAADVRAEGWAGLGIVEMTRNNRDLARVAFLRAIRADRRNAAAWYHLGLLYRDAFGYPEAALEQFEVFVRLEASASPRVQKVQRTIIPALKESVAQRLTDRPGASKRDSAASAASIAKAEAALKKSAVKTALQAYQAAVAADALSYPAALGLAKTLLKADSSKAGQEKALAGYQAACALRPSAISTYLEAGALAAKLGRPAQALEIYSRAVAASPTSAEALDGLIRALRKTGSGAKAAQAYQGYRDELTRKKK